MNEPKPFASLTSSLLARKGHAKPAMRPQGFQMIPEPEPRVIRHSFAADHDDLGWNDMGFEPAAAAPEPVQPVAPAEAVASREPAAVRPPVVEQQEQLVREFTPLRAVSDPSKPAVRAAPGSKGKSAFTLRLDPDRHLRLRLVCAVKHRSAQQIVTQALDEFLARQPEGNTLAVRSA